VFESSKYSFFLLYVVALPLFLEADYVLGIWLKEVPPYTVLFLRCIIVVRLIRSFATPIVQAVHASGNIKWLNLFGGGTGIALQIPFTFIFYKLGYPAESAFIIMSISSLICNFIELLVMKREIRFSILQYIYRVYMVGILIAIVVLFFLFPVYIYFPTGFQRLMLICFLSIISVLLVVFFVGMNRYDKIKIINIIKRRFIRLN
jgi:hypothetical protein